MLHYGDKVTVKKFHCQAKVVDVLTYEVRVQFQNGFRIWLHDFEVK